MESEGLRPSDSLTPSLAGTPVPLRSGRARPWRASRRRPDLVTKTHRLKETIGWPLGSFFSLGRPIVFPVERVHHREYPVGDEHLGGIGRAPHRLVDGRPLGRIDFSEHVIREVPSRIAAPDAD